VGKTPRHSKEMGSQIWTGRNQAEDEAWLRVKQSQRPLKDGTTIEPTVKNGKRNGVRTLLLNNLRKTMTEIRTTDRSKRR